MKEIANLERRLKNIDDELNSIKAFQEHNSTNFITVVRPALKASFPQKYVGKDGNQHLQRDLRYMKVACSGKIPNDLSSQNISALLIKGKSKVSSVVDSGVSSVATDTKSVSDDNVLSVPSKSMLDGSGAVNYQLTTLGTPYTGTMPQCISTPFQYMPWVYSSPPFDLYRTSYICINQIYLLHLHRQLASHPHKLQYIPHYQKKHRQLYLPCRTLSLTSEMFLSVMFLVWIQMYDLKCLKDRHVKNYLLFENRNTCIFWYFFQEIHPGVQMMGEHCFCSVCCHVLLTITL